MSEDRLDQLINSELQHHERWQQMHMRWDSQRERRRLAQRHRYLTIVSNVASVAALLVVGFLFQNVAAGIQSSSLESNIAPAAIEQVEPADTTTTSVVNN